MDHLPRLPESLIADIRRYGYEIAEEGLIIPVAKIMAGGVFDYELRRHGKNGGRDFWRSPNLAVDQGLNLMNDVFFHGTTQVSPWYVGLFEGDYTPVAGDTAATFPGSATECTAYDETTRVEYVEAASAGKLTTNSANRATFTFNAAKTIRGGFLSSVAAKGAITGSLFAADRGAASKGVEDDDVLLVAYGFTLSAV